MVLNNLLGLDLTRQGRKYARVNMPVFRDFVVLALEWKKPLILHVREATVEAMQVMTEVII